jgi:hypothetical protein
MGRERAGNAADEREGGRDLRDQVFIGLEKKSVLLRALVLHFLKHVTYALYGVQRGRGNRDGIESVCVFGGCARDSEI